MFFQNCAGNTPSDMVKVKLNVDALLYLKAKTLSIGNQNFCFF